MRRLADVAAEWGLTVRQVQHWAGKGYVTTLHRDGTPYPPKGRRGGGDRYVTHAEAGHVARMALLVAEGCTPDAAWRRSRCAP